jgi:hypothetical protein
MNKQPKYDPDIDDEKEDLSSYKILVKKDDDDEDESGAGTSDLGVEQLQQWLAALHAREVRKGEKKFGAVPDTQDPDSFLSKPTQSQGYGSQIKQHPLLARSQQFSGDDPKLTARAAENNKAQEEFVKEQLQKQLRAQNKHTLVNSARNKITLTR